MPDQEPSVLDYLKSRLKFWQRGEKIEIPAEEPREAVRKSVEPAASEAPKPRAGRPAAGAAAAVPPKKEAAGTPAVAPAQAQEKTEAPRRPFPWRSLLALILALVGQFFLDPPRRLASVAVYFYVLGAAFLIWGVLRKEWSLPVLPKTVPGEDPLTFRRLPLILSIPLALAAFLTFNNNLFTVLNVTLWVLAMICLAWGFWLPSPRARRDKLTTLENGPAVTGDLLANDRLVKGRKTLLTSARQGRRRISIGAAFTTEQGGSLVIQKTGAYTYTPPAWDRVPPEGLREEFRYTITDNKGARSSSTLTIDVRDSDRIVEPVSIWKRLRAFFAGASWQVNVTRWGLLVLAVAAVIVFYRVYRIGNLPSEPFSDHAEKILDVYDVTQGQTHIFFPRNTGREAIQMYLTVVVAWIFQTGLSFLSLKIDTVLCGLLTMPFMYLLGKEFGGKRVGLLAMLFAGIAYWPNVESRAGLRFTLYPLFVAPTLYYLIRGLRTRSRNDFILSGFFLGLGLHGYTPFRIVPLVVVIAVGLFLLHRQSGGIRQKTVIWLAILTFMSVYVFLPLGRYWVDNPQMFDFRALSRLGTTEQPLPGPAWQIFLSNTWNALRMFNWDDGEIWVNSITHRPALDIVSGALFLIGALLLFIRYVRQRHWLDLFLLLSVPLLLLPSILSLAFPSENPALNRAAGAMVPTFVIVAVALDGLLANLAASLGRRSGAAFMWIVALGLVGASAYQNYDLVFRQFDLQYRQGAWNTSEMGAVIKQFGETYGSTDSVWIVPYPYWVDTRLPGVWAGIPNRDFALWPKDLATSLNVSGAKLFMLKPEDTADTQTLEQLYPQGVLSTFHSATQMEGKDFLIYFVPPAK